MITFKQYLAESERYTPIPGDTEDPLVVLDFIEKHCSDAMWMAENDTPLWRGSNHGHGPGPMIVDPTLSERKSKTISNHYTVLLDTNPYMMDYPKRSRSLIAATKKFITLEYSSNTYAVIPFDRVPIGIVPGTDLWWVSFKCFGQTVDFKLLAEKLETLFSDSSFSKFKEFDDLLKRQSEEAVTLFTNTFGRATKKQRDNFLATLYNSISPENVGFKLANTFDRASFSNDSEVWIGGKCVIIPENMWEELIQLVRMDK